jgi:hypothetical protein
MTITDISRATVSDMTNKVDSYSVPTMQTDAATGAKETEWINTKWSQYFGYYKQIPELKKAIDALATWCVGKGYTTEDAETQVILEHITGWGEDTFNSIIWNLFVTKKVGGDAFAEIIRDEKTDALLNLKVLDPGKIKIIADEKGIIKRYEQMNMIGKEGKMVQKFDPKDILHLCNDRVADEIHGVSAVQACEWVIKARNEALTDWQTVLHRNVNPLKIIHVDTDDQTKIDELQTKYEKSINLKEVIFVPKGNVEVEIPQVSLQEPIGWIKYLENFFYQAVGVPKIIIGGSEEFTEASSKIAYLTFEQIYKREQQEFEKDLWNQCYIKLKLNQPASLNNEMLNSESKQPNYGTGMQESEMQPGRNE